MSISGLIDRLDDWLNPIVVKELRQAVKSRLVTAVLLLFLGVQLTIVALFLGLQEINTGGDPTNSRAGNQLFMVLQAILLGTGMVLIPTYASLRLSAERSDTNVDLLFVSTLRPGSIIAGKFFSALVLAMLVYSCCAPFMTFTYLLRGIDIPTIMLVMGIDLLAILLSVQMGLFLGAIPAPRALKALFFFLAFIGLCNIFGWLVAATSELVRWGIPGELNNEFWSIMGAITLAVLFLTVLFFSWSVALISPPSANRALLGRVCLVVMWLILGGVCLEMSFSIGGIATLGGRTGDHRFMMVWMVCSVLLFCVQFLISINERDSWGPRVTRSIPRWHILRPLAFLFYSGSAGGVFLSVIGVAVTLLVGWRWRETWPGFGFASQSDEVRRVFTVLALYTFCYGMTAVLLRAYLLGDKVRTVPTWVLALLLVGLGSSLPWLGAFLFSGNDFGRNLSLAWWMLPNPFWAMGEVSMRPEADFTRACFRFVGVWAAIASVLALPWVGRQVTRFHPPAANVGDQKPAVSTQEPEAVLATPAEAG